MATTLRAGRRSAADTGQARLSRKPTWNSTTNDLSRYKLSKEDLEEKIRSRQHKPLEEYSGPPILSRKQRADGTWYVTGTRPTSALAMLCATSDHGSNEARGRSRRLKASVSDDEDAKENVHPRRRSQSSGHATKLRHSAAVQESSGPTLRKRGSVCTTASNGTLLSDKSSEVEPHEEMHAPKSVGATGEGYEVSDTGNNSLNAEWDNMVLSEDISSSQDADTSASRDMSPGEPTRAHVQGCGENGPWNSHSHRADPRQQKMRAVMNGQSEMPTNKSESSVQDAAGVVASSGSGSGGAGACDAGNQRVRSGSGVIWMDAKRGSIVKNVDSKANKRISAVSEVMGDLRAERDRAERESRATDLQHLNDACEILHLHITQYEVGTGRHLQQYPPPPLERNDAVPGCYTEFLLKASARLFQYLGEAERSRELVAAELQEVRAAAAMTKQEVAELRTEMTVMREELAGKVEASKTDADAKLLALETQQQALAEQTASLFQSSEFQSVDSLLVNILAPVSQGPQESPSLNSVRGDGKPASRTVRSMTTPTRSPAIVSTTGAGAACSDDKKTRVDGNGKGGVLRDPLAMTRGVAYHEEEEEEEMYPLSPLSPQYAYQQADDDDDDGDEEEEVEAGAGAVRFSRQGGGRGRVDLLKTQHLFGPPPLSPVHESPLESTPIREAVERMVAVGKMSADEVDVLSAHELPLASSGVSSRIRLTAGRLAPNGRP